MHELSLFAHVASDSVSQILRALTAITGMSPRPILEHHLLFKPKKHRSAIGAASVPGGGAAGTGNADLYYLKLVADILEAEKEANAILDEAQNSTDGGQPVSTESGAVGAGSDKEKAKKYVYEYKKQKWTIKFADLPEVSGKRPVTSRLILNADIGEGDALMFIDSLGYTLEAECIISGYSFTRHDIHITLTRVLTPRNPFVPFPTRDLNPLDPCDSSILQAAVRVLSANEQESMTKGVEELKTLKAEMKGLVDLEVGDRLSLDTRVR